MAPQTRRPARNTTPLATRVAKAIATTPVQDIHTHLYDPAFGELLLSGIDDLLVYHYLVAEAFRYLTVPFEAFWRLSKREQAEWIWQELFLERSPVSEACRGVLTTLEALGIDVRRRDLRQIRGWFSAQDPRRHVDRVLDLAGVSTVCMTNSPFDDLERPVWERGFRRHDRFKSALRIDPLLLDWKKSCKTLQAWGYKVSPALTPRTLGEVRRFLGDWSRRLESGFLMVSLPPEFTFPDQTEAARLIEGAVVPHCTETGQPFALMPGVRRGVNPRLRMAGDGVGLSRLEGLRNLCDAFPETRFAVTALARENQHELCVLARKFRNLHLFGCWWFLNTPSLIGEMTQMRTELLGLSYTPQHSDARVLEQLIYKWRHSREVIGRVLVQTYDALESTGWRVSEGELRRDVGALFGGEFARFSTPAPAPAAMRHR
ncbi:MAG TPA: glucuronate isomerase [Verrucomicrobiales bacterium]|nr:glucuronate isomerase [Verrucomicrobiales bacterium]